MQKSQPAAEEDSEELPKLAELTPEKRTTDDLPNWLVDSDDGDPIIQSPTEITTEHYLDLVSDESFADSKIGLPDDAAVDVSDANLPDWLSEQALSDMDESDTPQPATAGSDIADWLADLNQPAEQEPPAREQSNIEPQSMDPSVADQHRVGQGVVKEHVTGWLSELEGDELFAAEPEDDLLEPLIPQSDIEPESVTPSVAKDHVTDWLSELEGDEAFAFAPEDGQIELLDDNEFDWMSELGPPETHILPAAADELDDALFAGEGEPNRLDEPGEFVDLQQLEEGPEDALPDWLSDFGQEEDDFMPADDAKVTGILQNIFAPEPAETDSVFEWLDDVNDTGFIDPQTNSLTEPSAPEQLDEPVETADDLAADIPDWLAELASGNTGPLIDEERDEPAPVNIEEPAAADEDTAADEEDDGQSAKGDWADVDESPDSVELENELPDWISRLDDIPSERQPSEAEGELPDTDNLPEWVADLRPGSGHMGSSLPSAFTPSDSVPLSEGLQGVPQELAGADLPDWLHDAPRPTDSQEATLSPGEMADIPDWLKMDNGARDANAAESALSLSGEEILSASASSEWSSLLSELPPALPPEQTLAKADIPEWIQDLKPSEKKVSEPAVEEPLQSSGPLSGMRGIIEVEPVIALPRSVTPLSTQFVITTEQQQQTALLRQLTQEEQKLSPAITTQTADTTAVWVRILLSGLLVVLMALSSQAPALPGSESVVPSLRIEQTNEAINRAAGQPVLLAFEYTPAMAGELTPQAVMLLAQLAANGSPLITVSQYAAGTAIAQASTAAYPSQNLGLIPGEAIGLRQFDRCLGQNATCESIAGRPLDASLRQALRDVGLIIVITGERDSLINWVEQVGAANDVPLLAGITQSLGPVAAPYFASGQLQGVLQGLPDTAVYEQMTTDNSAGNDGNRAAAAHRIRQQLNAQQVAQLLAGALLLVGGLTYGITGAFSRQAGKRK